MLTSWLWIHSPDRHRGDVVCSNRSLELESTSSVVNERLLTPQVHQHKKRKNHTDDRREQLRRGSEDRPCTHSPARRSIDVVDVSSWSIPRFQASFSRSITELFWNLRLLFVRVEPVHRAWKPKESPLGWRWKPPETSDIGPGVEWRRKASVDRNDCVWCVCVMTRCQVAQGNQNKMAKLPRTSLNCDTVLADWIDEGKVFQRIIARGIKLARLDILLTAGTGYGSLRNWYSQTWELRPPKGLGVSGPIFQVVSFARFGSKFFNMELYTCPCASHDISDRWLPHVSGGVIGNDHDKRSLQTRWSLVRSASEGKVRQT